MLGKCLWKMFNHVDNVKSVGGPRMVEVEDVLYAFNRAIETIPPRSSRSDKPPLLEPHYKLISVVHKMVRRNELEVSLPIETCLRWSTLHSCSDDRVLTVPSARASERDPASDQVRREQPTRTRWRGMGVIHLESPQEHPKGRPT